MRGRRTAGARCAAVAVAIGVALAVPPARSVADEPAAAPGTAEAPDAGAAASAANAARPGADAAALPAAIDTAPRANTGAAAVASPVTVHATVEPDTVTIGTRFRFRVEVSAAPDTEVLLAQPTERIGEFDIVDFGDEPPQTRDGKRVVVRWYSLVGFETGHHLIPSPPVHFRAPSGELAAVPGDEAVVTIESLLAKQPQASDIRDIKGPDPVPRDPRPLYIAAGGLAALVLFAVALYRVLNREKRARPRPPPRPAHEVAAEELERLRARRLVEAGAFKEYYSGLSGIVRAYLERAFRLRAPEMTTEEFLQTTARGGVLQGAHRTLLADFLRESDLVKFARHVPTIADSERAYEAAARFVRETAAPRITGEAA